MALFRRKRSLAHLPPPPAQEQRFGAPGPLFAYLNAFTGYGANGSSVTLDQALRTSAFWACLRVLAGSVSTLPVDVVKVDGPTRTPVAAPSLLREPSVTVGLEVWLHQFVTSMYDDGNGFGLVTAMDRDSRPTYIESLAPDVVTHRRVEDGIARVRVDGTDHALWPHGPVFHVPGPLVLAGSPFGLSPRAFASGSIDATMAAQKFGSGFLNNGAVPSAILKLDGANPTDKQAEAAKEGFVRAAQDREPVVMGGSWSYEQIQVNPSDSQFLELQRFIIEDVCRYMGVPPSMAYAATSGQNVTYANVSQADLHYLKHSLEVPLTRLEWALSRCIARGQVVKFNRAALLRADALTRWQVLDKRLRNRSMTVNEARALEDEKPFDDPLYDEPGIPGGPNDAGAPPSDKPQEGQ